METLALLERHFPGRKAELKRTILHKALICFNEQGIEATTIEVIRAACDTSVGAIYHHFGNKEGLVAALFFAALDDQSQLRSQYFENIQTIEDGVCALVYSYVDWIDRYAALAKFLFAARFSVARGPHGHELSERNMARNKAIFSHLKQLSQTQTTRLWPLELLPSVIIGPSENYCRAWLSGRVEKSPKAYRDHLAKIACASIQAI